MSENPLTTKLSSEEARIYVHDSAPAEEWLATQVTSPSDVGRMTEFGEPAPIDYELTDPVPVDIAGEVALAAQKRLGLWEKHDLFPDETQGLEDIRNKAIKCATELDFGVVSNTVRSEWPLRVRLNAMHDKFKHVTSEQISDYLGSDPDQAEYSALFIRDIINDNAPQLLTPDLRVLTDPTQPAWRIASSQAAILFKNRNKHTLASYPVDMLPSALPVSARNEYIDQDDQLKQSIPNMTEDTLALFAPPQAISVIRERGYALFGELSPETQQSLLTRRLFETIVKSTDAKMKQEASARNAAFENQAMLQEGDLVHATYTPAILEKILTHGLQCGESINGNTRGIVNFPFTVSFLEVDNGVAAHELSTERFAELHNTAYGPINLVLQRDKTSTDFGHEQSPRHNYQKQIFGGLPSTEVKGIIIRQTDDKPELIQGVIDKIVKHGMFIPVYDGATGELLFSSKDYVAQQQVRKTLGAITVNSLSISG